MIIYRMNNGNPMKIMLKRAEMQKAHKICQQNEFETDFADRYRSRFIDGIGLCNLPPENLLEQPDILKKAYAYYQEMQDCNVAYNDTMAAVINKVNLTNTTYSVILKTLSLFV